MSSLVAIVGRPNVGKSTLFNRLIGSRQAIVTEIAGTTRDRQYGHTSWTGRDFSIVDTGGWVSGSDDIFETEINKQVEIAIEEANVILFVVDVMNGMVDLDREVANLLRRSKKPILLVANKADTFEIGYQSAEFYALGLGEPYSISAMNGSGTGDLLDAIVNALPPEDSAIGLKELPRFAIIGRPNAGKSSLINAFIGEERNIVTNQAGTTRDSIYTEYNKFGLNFYLVDTAGIRKKGKVQEDLEYYSVIRSIRAIENSDVCIALIDATRGIESQDVNILSLVMRNSKGLVVCVNKWDLVQEKSNQAIRVFEEAIRSRLAPFSDFPIIFISALTKQRIFKVLETANAVYERRSKRIPTHKLNEVLLPIIEATPPPSWKGKYIKIKYVAQLPTAVPSFAFYANLPQWVKEPYKRFLENKIRENWDFSGIPINIFIREK
ncbi:ribosome biogenesis GTPase Der [Porphyromonas circumdentaria]|uniref:GTPase Der n=1 Tax=Porphyromonas circumdentaria TaxID=29524 RepID=A0A1T4M4P0_9PORP|nr:ribosome biogenesis GTPase Der [Porphyromonas circumdentaria]MBB6275575.1 GTP-binding protein [Porphyromonas circumdentaria]MDO4722130.1 ribosome biogenesis GTPase Der [Porphyromonas circumdentaria]SJZ61892.1 GTP-binding protein [Porphyromonas circumdentaria]